MEKLQRQDCLTHTKAVELQETSVEGQLLVMEGGHKSEKI
jgi:hypothetical protein